MAKSKRYTSTKRTTAPRRAAVKKPAAAKVSHGSHGHRTVNAPKSAY